MRIEDIDTNFRAANIDGRTVRYLDIRTAPIKIYGVTWDEELGRYIRLPQNIAERTSMGVACNDAVSGGRVKFVTDSEIVAIKTVQNSASYLGHMATLGVRGLTIYVDNKYCGSYVPPMPTSDGRGDFEGVKIFGSKKYREITIYFPLYNCLNKLEVGVEEDSEIFEAAEYTYPKPILFYGSSITQGGCASRPGNSYDAIVCRNLDSDYINLGYSGCCKAEPAMVEYLPTIDASIFVFDYDHNAPDKEYLEATHYNLYNHYRAMRPNTPIILMSKPDFDSDLAENALRKRVVMGTYTKALDNGDQNIYYIDGEMMFESRNRDCCTVDGCHPNDLGFERMADKVERLIRSHRLLG